MRDFDFCPKSIYFGNLYENYENAVYKDIPQIRGTLNHTKIDQKSYSTSKDILQWTSVYSEKYHLIGKIDVFHISKKSLMERKSHISELYKGYVYQLYAQYFCLTEMGYQVEKLKLYSMDDNQVYEIPLPDEQTTKEFEEFLDQYQRFNPATTWFTANAEKCKRCIYCELCDSSLA